MTIPNPRDAALHYARLGWAVLPIHSINEDGTCTCRRPDCSSPGKHPMTSHGVKDATTDAEEIEAWFGRWPRANIGIATGRGSNLFVIDIDPRHGGHESLKKLHSRYGLLPKTVKSLTGGAGEHLLFAYPQEERWVPSKPLPGYPGLDLRADGACIVVPPSIHKSGVRYEWADKEQLRKPRLPTVPGFLVELACPTKGQEAKPVQRGQIGEGGRHTFLTSLAGFLRHHGLPQNSIETGISKLNTPLCSPPLPEAEVAQIAASIARYPSGRGVNGASWPSSMRQDAFHGLTGDIVRTIEPHTEADPVALLVQLLTAYGNVTGLGSHFLAEADRHALKLFVVLAGETSKGRKGTSMSHIMRLFADVDEYWASNRVVTGLSSGEGLIWHVRDPITKTEAVRERGKPTGEYVDLIVDRGIKDKRLLILEPEFAGPLHVLNRQGNTLMDIIRVAWDKADLQVLTKNNPVRATNTHISIIGHSTIHELRRCLTATQAANGFGNRFLWMCVRRSKQLPDGGQISTVDFSSLVSRLKEAVLFGKQPRVIVRSRAANELWKQVYSELSRGKPGLVGDLTARAEAQVMRLACIYALLDLSDVIKAQHLKAALAVWEYADASAKHIFGASLGYPLSDRLLAELSKCPQGMTRTDIRDFFQRHRAPEVSQALGYLEECGLARRETRETEGRPAEVWFAC